MFQEIISKNNEQLKYLRKLNNKSFRDQENAFSIEGTKLFLEAVSYQLNFRQIFVTKDWLETNDGSVSDRLTKLSSNDVAVLVIKESLFPAISTLQKPEGIICILKKMSFQTRTFKSYILLEDVQDPYNVGTIIRTADAAGIECVVTSPKTADIYNEKVLRGSMGSVFHLPIVQADSLLDFAVQLKTNQITLIGTSLSGISLWDREPINEPYAIVMGNESKGMSPEMSDQCDVLLKIPIIGSAESLNVGTAAGIVIYDIVKDFK
ncbi:MAG: RNA methyltransferase [Firmicutes bacterium]|nr:RNA methyltransferase [Bacillota bacterium]